MNINWLSEYSLTTGLFTGRRLQASIDFLPSNIAVGCDVIEGEFNPDLDSVDLNTSPFQVILGDEAARQAYANKPTDHLFYVWNRQSKSWVDNRTLDIAKMLKIRSIKSIGAGLIQTVFPALSDVDEIKLLRELYLSIAPAARQPTADMTRVIGIWQAARDAIVLVNAATTIAEVDAIVPSWPA